MITPKELTKRQWLALADGIAHGHSMLAVSGAVGVDRTYLRQWFARDGMMDELARRIGSPDALRDDALAVLFDERIQGGERGKAYELRRAFGDKLREVYPNWFAARKREAEEAEAVRKREAEAEAREIAVEIARSEAEAERMLGCLRADFWNLQTLVELQAREWANGTPGELKRGLDTAKARRQYRCAKGIGWTCAGFGCYFAPRWSADRCRMRYAIDDGLTFGGIASEKRYSRAWKEIETEDDDGAHWCDPFARRDPKLPTVEVAAKALLDRVMAGGSLVGWKWKPHRAAKQKKDK